MDTEDVVVDREHVEVGRSGASLGLDGNLRVVDAGEVAGTGGLMLLRLEREGVGVHTGEGGASVVVEGLDLVEVLTSLLLEAILAVKHKFEGVDGADELFGEGNAEGRRQQEGGTGHRSGDEAVTGNTTRGDIGREHRGVGAGEVPQVGAGDGPLVSAPHKLLNGVVVGEADLLGLTGGSHGIGASVLNLLDEVFVSLLGEAATLLGVEVDVVRPHLEDVGVKVGVEGGRKVDVDAHFVVLEGDEGEVQPGVAVEEEDEGKVDRAGGSGGHLTPSSLLGLVEVKLGVQTPPLLVVLVDALATDGKFNVVDGTLSDPVAIVGGMGSGGVGGDREELEVHVTDKITVTGNSHGHATGVGGSTVDGLLDVFHREVGVALVFRLVEGNFGVTSEVDVLGAVSDELHETTSHCECFVLYTEKIILGKCAFPDPDFSQSIINVGTA